MSIEFVSGPGMALCPHDGNGCIGHSRPNDCLHLHQERPFHVNDCVKRQASMKRHPEQYKRSPGAVK